MSRHRLSGLFSAACVWLALFVVVVVVCSVDAQSNKKRGVERHIKIINESGSKVEVYWVHPSSRETVLMSDPHVVNGAEFPLDSFVGHEFEVRELPASNGECREQVCRQAYFKVSENDEQVSRINSEFEVEFVDNKVKAELQASDLIKECQTKAKLKLVQAGTDATKAAAAVDQLLACVETGVATALETINEEIAFQASVRKDIAATLENYTCVDLTLNTSKDITTTTWKDPYTNVVHPVHVKHERSASRIHLIENFINDDECEAMEAAATKSLHRATVADGKGGSRLSENRKAMQAGITVPWNNGVDIENNPIARLSRRVYNYTEHVLHLGIIERGQEDLMSIQYFGRGADDPEPDRYTPHCDGDCTGMPHKHGNRMATMVMYCKVATKGGHTNFRNAGVHIKSEPNNAIFFSYIDPDTLTMDTGFTEHSGCPVFEGEKKIVTQWIRLGVDDEKPWDSFNTLGIHKSLVVD